MSPTLLLALYVLTVMRVTRLINFDTIMYWLHNLVGNTWDPNSWQAEFISCPWCVGMWVSLFTAWVPMLFLTTSGAVHYVAMYLMIALATSMVTGLLAPLSAEDTAMESVEKPDKP